MAIDEKTRFIGTQYYRHPNPPFEDWDRDLALIRDSGLKVVRTWLYWLRTNPSPGQWDFSDYDRFVQSAERFGLKVLIQLVPECAPQWFIHQHPDAMLRHVGGRPEIPKAVGMAMVGGYPGLCPDVPTVRDQIAEFLTRTAERYHRISHLLAMDLWNELMPYYWFPTQTCHPATQEKYRDWLRAKFSTIEALNEAFGGWRYTAFEQVKPLPYSDYVDEQHWHNFVREWITEQLAWRRDVVKAVDANIPVATHTPGGLDDVTLAPFDTWALADVVDIWGTSDYETDYYKSAAYLCSMASAAAGKPWWLGEQAGGRVWGLYGHAVRSPAFIEQKMLTAFSYGAQANLCWQWRPERLGTESPNFGVTAEDGSPHASTEVVARLAHSVNEHTDLWRDFELEPADVGLVIDWRVRSWEWVAFRDAGKIGEPEVLGWFKALSDVGANVEFVHLERMAERGIDSRYKMLVMPMCTQDSAGLQDRLATFVENGGTVVAGPYFLIYGEDCFVSTEIPPARMQTLFGGRRDRLTYPPQDPPGFQPTKVTLLPAVAGAPMDIEGRHVVEIYDCHTAKPILQKEKEVAGTCHQSGRGRAYRLGTLMGLDYDRDANPGLARLLQSVLDQAGCSRFPLATGSVMVREARSGSDRLLFVANTADEPTHSWIALERARRVEDLITGQVVSIDNDGQLRLTLEARQTVLLRMID